MNLIFDQNVNLMTIRFLTTLFDAKIKLLTEDSYGIK